MMIKNKDKKHSNAFFAVALFSVMTAGCKPAAVSEHPSAPEAPAAVEAPAAPGFSATENAKPASEHPTSEHPHN